MERISDYTMLEKLVYGDGKVVLTVKEHEKHTIVYDFKSKRIFFDGQDTDMTNPIHYFLCKGVTLSCTILKEDLGVEYYWSDFENVFANLLAGKDKNTDKKFTEEHLSVMETFFILRENELTDFDESYDFPFITSIPKGYIAWLKEKGEKANKKNYEDFMVENAMKKMTKQKSVFFNNVKEQYFDSSEISVFKAILKTDITIFDKIYQIMLNTFKNGNISSLTRINRIFREDYLNYYNEVDTSKDLEFNIKLLDTAKDKIKNDKIAKELQKLNFLNGKEIFDGLYTIVVPQSVSDLVKEGEEQNNCVGSYYNDNILNGRDLIFFIRKTESKDKSYITARYHVKDKEVCEYRLARNESVDDVVDKAVCKQAERIINNYLQ